MRRVCSGCQPKQKLKIKYSTECQVAPDTTPKYLEILEGEKVEVHNAREQLVPNESKVICPEGNLTGSLVLNGPKQVIFAF